MKVLIVGYLNEGRIRPEMNSLVNIRPDIYRNEKNENEYCLKVYLMENGIEAGLIGFVGREFHKFRQLYENKLGQICTIYSNSNNLQHLRESEKRNGVCVAKILN